MRCIASVTAPLYPLVGVLVAWSFAAKISDPHDIIRKIQEYGGHVLKDRSRAGVYVDHVDLADTKVKDTDLNDLRAFPYLVSIDLSGTSIGDAGLRTLAGFGSLEVLRLNETKVTDKGMKYLAPLKRLEILDLADTTITDGGLVSFKQLKKVVLPELHFLSKSMLHHQLNQSAQQPMDFSRQGPPALMLPKFFL